MTCAARRYSDTMSCAPCGVTWDVSDPEPPTCGLQCLGAAEPAVDPVARLVRLPMAYHTPTYEQLDPDFDDMPHTLLETCCP